MTFATFDLRYLKSSKEYRTWDSLSEIFFFHFSEIIDFVEFCFFLTFVFFSGRLGLEIQTIHVTYVVYMKERERIIVYCE